MNTAPCQRFIQAAVREYSSGGQKTAYLDLDNSGGYESESDLSLSLDCFGVRGGGNVPLELADLRAAVEELGGSASSARVGQTLNSIDPNVRVGIQSSGQPLQAPLSALELSLLPDGQLTARLTLQDRATIRPTSDGLAGLDYDGDGQASADEGWLIGSQAPGFVRTRSWGFDELSVALRAAPVKPDGTLDLDPGRIGRTMQVWPPLMDQWPPTRPVFRRDEAGTVTVEFPPRGDSA